MLFLGYPCPTLTVANSNDENKTGVYETVLIVLCAIGYVTPEIKRTFWTECQHNGTWNVTTCNSRYYGFICLLRVNKHFTFYLEKVLLVPSFFD